jgi:very-short-patch-repair endonuclease
MPVGIYNRKPMSQITKDKIRLSKLGKKATPETKVNMSLANKKAWESPEKRAKFHKSMKETLSTPEHVETMRNNMKKQWERGDFEGVHNTPEMRKNMSIITKNRWKNGDFDGVVHTPESNLKHKKFMKDAWANGVFDGIHQTPEARENHSKAMKKLITNGVYDECHQTPEYREKQSKLCKLRWKDGGFATVSEKNRIKSKEQWASGRMDGVFSSPTTIEIMLYKFLEENNISYTKRKTINIGYKTRKPDAFIEPNFVLEADGTYHHSENVHGKDKKSDDARADLIMKEMGYIIYRIPEPDFRNGKYLETLSNIFRIGEIK